MIKKIFELKNSKEKIFLFHGENLGLKKEIIQNYFKKNINSENIYNYEENEIIKKKEILFDHLLNESFFNAQKLITINKTTDKILNIFDEFKNFKLTDLVIICLSDKLDTKSKIRKFFEKHKDLVSTPFYKDDDKTLILITRKFFADKGISISQEMINVLVDKSSGDRLNLTNELAKIESYTSKNKKINLEELLKLTTQNEDIGIFELVDFCLVKNKKKVIKILNENNYSNDDSIMIVRIFLKRCLRLLDLQKHADDIKSTDMAINSFKPPIFWKEKESIKLQLKIWTRENLLKFINKINNLELNIKKNSQNSLILINDFIFSSLRN